MVSNKCLVDQGVKECKFRQYSSRDNSIHLGSDGKYQMKVLLSVEVRCKCDRRSRLA